MADFLALIPVDMLHDIPGTKCPITFLFMTDPVLLRGTGDSYERVAITAYLKARPTDPKTGRELTSEEQSLIPNVNLRNLIQRIQERIGAVVE